MSLDLPNSPAAAPQPPPPAPEPPMPTAIKVAGGVFLINVVLLMVEALLIPKTGGRPNSFMPAIIDAIIGASLLRGNMKYLTWARVRVGLGLLVFGAINMAQGDPWTFVMQLVFTSGLLLLLMGQAGPRRMRAGISLVGVYMLVEVYGLFIIGTGTVPLAGTVGKLNGDLLPIEGGVVTGKQTAYALHVPDGWMRRSDEAAHKDSALADLWVTRPELDAHLFTIAEEVDEGDTVDIDTYAKVVVDNSRRAATSQEVLSTDKLKDGGRIIHIKKSVNGLDVEMLYGLHTWSNKAIQLVAFSSTENFAKVEPQLRTMLDSFKPGAE